MQKSSVVIITIGVCYMAYMWMKTSSLQSSKSVTKEKIRILDNLQENACEFYSSNVTVLQKCQNFEKNIKPHQQNCKVTVIGSSSEDITANVKLCEEYLLPDVTQLTPQFYPLIQNFTEFQQHVLFFAQTGSSFEITATTEMMTLLIEKLEQCSKEKEGLPSSIIKVSKSLGGNGATIANRMAMLGCQVDLYSSVPKQFVDILHSNVVLHQLSEQHDIHLALQLWEKVKLTSQIQAKRTNRFYINNDKYNIDIFTQKVLSQIEIADDVSLVVLTGLQLLDQKVTDYEAIYSVIQDFVQKLHQKNIKVHTEAADISDPKHYQEFLKFVQTIDSIGLNEQEVKQILTFSQEQRLLAASESKPTFEDLIDDFGNFLNRFFKDNQLNRVHLHSLKTQIICNKKDAWSTSRQAVSFASLIGTQYVCGKKYLQVENLDKPDVDEVTCSGDEKFASIFSNINENIQCCISPTLTCTKVVNTVGAGDNISGTGLAFQRINK